VHSNKEGIFLRPEKVLYKLATFYHCHFMCRPFKGRFKWLTKNLDSSQSYLNQLETYELQLLIANDNPSECLISNLLLSHLSTGNL